ncbi:MAG: head GIN domain-containing protein [Bacteroidota bacterium]|nr:head GIN domain-containing protein [Bacteroidota bacterium]
MKSLKFFASFILFIAIAASVSGQIRRTVYGNGHVVKQDRQAGRFEGIRVSTGIDVYLRQGESESISVEADENLQEYIETDIRDGILNVYTDANIRKAESKKVFVTIKDVTSLRTSSAGDIIGETPIKTGDLKLSASSAGDIKLEVYANSIDADISSSGDVTLSGKIDRLDVSLSSAGDLNAYELEVKEADVSASSAGDADVNVSERLTARASSAGDINYRGNPRYIDAHSSSAGGIHRK